MQKYMKELKPTVFAGFNCDECALYRPGPIKYIPSFIKEKTAKKKLFTTYQKPKNFKRNLRNYGLSRTSNAFSQKLADFSKGDADVLRKAMGKKQKMFWIK
jgi:DNA polymerase-3 subunit alpha